MTPRSQLVGTWELVAFTEYRDDGSQFDVFGPDPKGRLTYMESGRMSVVFAGAHRTPFSGAWTGVPDRHKAECFDTMVAYAGRYTDHGDRVVHHVEVCWIPNWEGRDLERYLGFLPDGRVRLRTPAMRAGRPQPVQDVIVQRAAGS